MSLRAEDVEFLDAYAAAHDVSSRSAVVQEAITALRREELPEAYDQAWREWEAADDGEVWEGTAGDGF